MIPYPKINSLYKRIEEPRDGKRSFIEGQYASEEFDLIKHWQVQEKIDGTNIRVHYHHGVVSFDGRKDGSQIPKHLLKFLTEHFTLERMSNAKLQDDQRITLYGEGYGPKIQSCGGNYRSDVGFILYDIRIGSWWLDQDAVQGFAGSLEVPYAPIIGAMTTQEAINFTKSNPLSLCSKTPQVMEGIICRPYPLLLKRNGEQLIMKLKCKDWL
jgi:hypothetical protein